MVGKPVEMDVDTVLYKRGKIPLQVVMFEIVAGNCSICNKNLYSPEMTLETGFTDHSEHIGKVTFSAVVINLPGYHGLELKLPAELVAAHDRSGQQVTVPCSIFSLHCEPCRANFSPTEIWHFRANHASHVHGGFVHLVAHSSADRVKAWMIQVRRQHDHEIANAAYSCSPLIENQIQQLKSLWMSFNCIPLGFECRACQMQEVLQRPAEAEQFLAEHVDHMKRVYVTLLTKSPVIYGGLHLRIMAQTFPKPYLTSEMRMDCMMLELFAEKSDAARVTPWSRGDIDGYLGANPDTYVFLKALVFGRAGRLFKRVVELGFPCQADVGQRQLVSSGESRG